MNVGIVGCGRAGERRARGLGAHRLLAVADLEPERAAHLAASHPGCCAERDWPALVARPDLEAIVVATTPDALVPVAAAALGAGKHVLVEKPVARTTAELDTLVSAARAARRHAKAGFNHRHHPAIAEARRLACDGAIGPLLYLRGRYGHGGRPGYEREWRADPGIAGGGELLDQGSHLIDLARWFLGDFVDVVGRVGTFYWKMPVEDNAFLMLATATGRVAWLHASWTEWKNLFSLEVFGETGKLQVDGLGGSYGVPTLTWYRMPPGTGVPDVECWEYPGEDRSWAAEFDEFAATIARGGPFDAPLADARAVLDVVTRVYGARGVTVTEPP